MKGVIFIGFAIGLLTFELNATKYFVSPLGNDLSNGKSLALAFRTLQKAANTVTTGDSVLVSDSTYAGFDLRTSGTSIAPIVFLANGSQVIINRRNAITPDGINIENANWIQIIGFKVINQPRAGIRAALANHITVRNNICLNNQRWGIFTGFTDDFIAEYNECAYSVLEHGIYVSNSSDRAIVRFNKSHDNRAAGLHFNGDISQGGDGINHDTQVYGNVIYRNGFAGGAAINMDGNQNALIYNNVLYNNHATGIAMFQIDGGGPSTGARIYHNTIVQDDTSRWCVLLIDGASNAIIKNNILINQHSFRGAINVDPASRTGLMSDYNLMTNRFTLDDNSNIDSTAWKNLGYDTHSIFSPVINNLFKDFANGDLSLIKNSKAINFGVAGLVPNIAQDINGTSRPIGAAPDAGAFEASFASLPLHWISNSIHRLTKGIEINGTLVDIESTLTICLQKWNSTSQLFETIDCQEILLRENRAAIAFKQSPSSGIHEYRLLARKLDGEMITSGVMSISIQSNTINYFPNPTNDYVNINPSKDEDITACIFDQAGRFIKYTSITKGRIDLHEMGSGKYLIALMNGKHILQVDWVIKK